MTSFAQKIERLTEDMNKSAVARRASINVATLHSYLRRGSSPSSDVAVRLARALHVDVGWLIDDARDFPAVRTADPQELTTRKTAA